LPIAHVYPDLSAQTRTTRPLDLCDVDNSKADHYDRDGHDHDHDHDQPSPSHPTRRHAKIENTVRHN